ncbi:ADP-ribosylation [Schizopora paradoxa]|uniref:Poly [ADP-ribose] polymerase n=1 Tax=Schizopora paradoxa TaxID=27342 RepID=A0A0H2SDW4_9AGAM|nr:ADP-ribosylation [Schizopora paradoxa]
MDGHDKILQLVKDNSPEYKKVKSLLKSGWKHSEKRKPQLRRLFRIVNNDAHYKPFAAYQKRIQTALHSDSKGATSATECLLFHGTTRACLVGEDDAISGICNLPRCSLCRIIENSFDVKFCGSQHKFKRFGKAIYTTSCTSKADDYASNAHPSATTRVLLLSRVVLGKQFTTKLNSSHLLEPPEGYHSVRGVPGVHLNYEEAVVYNNDAIRPAYLVVYQLKPKLKLSKTLQLIFGTPLA